MSRAWTPQWIREVLQYAPAETSTRVPDLMGFLVVAEDSDHSGHSETFVCGRCCDRLAGRGLLLPRASTPVWRSSDRKHKCAGCEAPLEKEGDACDRK